MEATHKPSSLVLASKLEKMGFEDVLVLSGKTAQEIQTEKRKEIIQTVKENQPRSITQIADTLDRDKSRVSKDIKKLVEADIIELKKGKGRSKQPALKHDTILTEPIVLEDI